MRGCCSFTVEQQMTWNDSASLLEIGYSEGTHLVTTKLLCTGTLQTSLKEITVEVNMLYRKLKTKNEESRREARLEAWKRQMIGIYFLLFMCIFLLPPWVRFSGKVPYQTAFEMTHIWLGQ